MGSTTGRGSSDPRCLDRDIPRDHRAYTGAFFTPSLWVDEAHREMDRVLGPNWRRDCVVWDCAAGTGNLTRDKHDWGCLISSTAERPDVGAMRDHGWGGHHVFQYDFLNPDAESPFFEDGVANVVPASVDRALREAAKAGKRLVFFMNPPYGTAGVQSEESRAGIAITAVNAAMKDAKLGAPSQQLYAQFMFQASGLAKQYGFKDCTVALFSKPTFMSSGSYKPFRDWWYGAHEYRGGFLFQASHFADVSGRWGVSFTIWNSGRDARTDAKKFLPIRLTDVIDFAVGTTAIKEIYNADGREASKWVREPVAKLRGVDAPQMKSGLIHVPSGEGFSGNLGFWANHSNAIQYSTQLVFILSSAYAPGLRNGGSLIDPVNWRRVVALYGARKLVEGNWINDKDEYLVPDEMAPGYGQWVDDLHVYALLHASNNCTAMRDVEYKGKSWRIKNHFFWRTRAEMIDLLDAPETPQLYRDARMEPLDKSTAWGATGDAYLAHLLATGLRDRLSPDVRALLDTLDQLMVDSMRHRENFAAGREDLHLTSWDAGVYQLKTLWQATDATRYKALRAAFHACAARLKSGTFEYGFLRR